MWFLYTLTANKFQWRIITDISSVGVNLICQIAGIVYRMVVHVSIACRKVHVTSTCKYETAADLAYRQAWDTATFSGSWWASTHFNASKALNSIPYPSSCMTRNTLSAKIISGTCGNSNCDSNLQKNKVFSKNSKLITECSKPSKSILTCSKTKQEF